MNRMIRPMEPRYLIPSLDMVEQVSAEEMHGQVDDGFYDTLREE